MQTLKRVIYDTLEELNETTRIERIFRIPVFSAWLTDDEIDRIDMKNFVFPGKRNYDWYFSEKTDSEICEEWSNVYLSKTYLEDNKYEYLDYVEEAEVYMFIETKNG